MLYIVRVPLRESKEKKKAKASRRWPIAYVSPEGQRGPVRRRIRTGVEKSLRQKRWHHGTVQVVQTSSTKAPIPEASKTGTRSRADSLARII
jgi:hypothetical protein